MIHTPRRTLGDFFYIVVPVDDAKKLLNGTVPPAVIERLQQQFRDCRERRWRDPITGEEC